MPRVRDRLRAWRLNRGMTQVELGRELGVSGSVVSGWERGRRAMRASRADEITGFGCAFRRLLYLREHGRAWKAHGEAILSYPRDVPARVVAVELGVSTMTVWRWRKKHVL